MIYETYREDNQEQEVDVGNVMELVVQVLRYETQGSVLGSPNLVSPVVFEGKAILVDRFGR
jgi:hypothetical protein